ncbi:MAG: hypothetical protein K6T78_10010 [Alicyclobacillus sp.]|nr:hypothetical protein [Alicyclobacillus sp.]
MSASTPAPSSDGATAVRAGALRWSLPLWLWMLQFAATLGSIFLFRHIVPRGPFHIPYGIDTLGAWDGGHYLAIAERGYQSVTDTAFFPIYPLAIRWLHRLAQLPYLTSAVVVSQLSLLAALFVLDGVWGRNRAAAKALCLLAAFPTAFFFNVAYTESVTLFLYAIFFFALRRGSWWTAVVAAAVATGVHDLNVLLALPALLAWFRDRPSARGWRRGRLLSISLIPLALVAYMAFLGVRFGHPLAFLMAEAQWGRHFTVPVLNLFQAWPSGAKWFGPARWDGLTLYAVNAGATLLFYALGVGVVRCRSLDLGTKVFYVATALASTTSSTFNGIESFGRFMVVLFPAYPVLARWCRPLPLWLLAMVVFLAGRVALAGFFGAGYVVT